MVAKELASMENQFPTEPMLVNISPEFHNRRPNTSFEQTVAIDKLISDSQCIFLPVISPQLESEAEQGLVTFDFGACSI